MRVILTRLSSLGDVVHTLPLAAALRGAGHVVCWVVEPEYRPLVAAASGAELVVEAATRRWRVTPAAAAAGLVATRTALRRFRPDVALDPQGLVKSAIWAWLAGCRRRVGLARGVRREWLAGLFYTETLRPSPVPRHVIDLNLSLLAALAIEPPWGAQPDALGMLANRAPAVPTGRRAPVVLLAATGRRAKTWPAERFAALARSYSLAGWPVLVAWGPGEREAAERIARAAGPGVEVAPPTSLPELAALLAASAAVVGGDTGPLHLAAALGVPAVGIYLATDPARNGPRGPRALAIEDRADPAGPRPDAVAAALVDLLHPPPG